MTTKTCLDSTSPTSWLVIRPIPTTIASCLVKTIIKMTLKLTMVSTPAYFYSRNLTQPWLSRQTCKLHSRLNLTRMLKCSRDLLLWGLKGMELLLNLWGAMIHRKLTSLFGARTSKASLAKIKQRKCLLYPDFAYSKEPKRFKKLHVAILIRQF